MIREHSAHLTPLSVDFRTWLWRYTYLLLLISMLWHRQAIFKSKGDKLCSSAECRIWTRGPRHQIASRLNTRWQTHWAIEDQADIQCSGTGKRYSNRKETSCVPLPQTECSLTNPRAIEDQANNLNSTARPYDQRAFSPLDPTVSWLTHLALAIYIFVVVNFDALAQASDIQIERRQVVFLCWMQDLNPGPQTGAKSPADWMLADKPPELWRIKRAFSPLDPTVSWLSHLALAIYLLLLISMLWHRASDIRKETSCVPPLSGFEPGLTYTKSPAGWMLGDQTHELSRISDNSALLTPLSVDFRTWLWAISMLWHRQAIFKSKGDKLSSSAECRIWTRGPRHQIWQQTECSMIQIDWARRIKLKTCSSTARPYDQR